MRRTQVANRTQASNTSLNIGRLKIEMDLSHRSRGFAPACHRSSCAINPAGAQFPDFKLAVLKAV
jgi:hypothetical protein